MERGKRRLGGLEETLGTLAPDLVERLEAGIDVLDAGCGAGRAVVALAQRFPASRVVGYDVCPEAVILAQGATEEAGTPNASFEVRDLSRWDDRDRWDLTTSFDAVHDTRHPHLLLKAVHRALGPGGVHLMQDIGGSAKLEQNAEFPFAAFLYAVSCVHCTPVSLAQDGDGLGTMWGWETAEAMLRQAGFRQPSRTVLAHDPMNVWFVFRKA